MEGLVPRAGELNVESVPLSKIAREFGTPVYVYSKAVLKGRCRELIAAFRSHPTLACYAVKANGNLSVLREIFEEGLGADVVSIGELERAIAGGASPGKMVFSGVGKTDEEMSAALDRGIRSFNVESTDELDRLAALAKRAKKKAPIALRVNPNIDAKTNPYIATGLHSTKFGIAEDDLPEAVRRVKAHASLQLKGLACHIGSQILELGPFEEAARRMARLSEALRADGLALESIDLGGGLGIRYDDETPPTVEAYAAALLGAVRPTGLELVLEPGRWIVGNAGCLVARVIGTKRTPAKRFLIVDAAMNDLIRPSLYGAYHAVVPLKASSKRPEPTDVVGPICESGDFLAQDRPVPPLEAGDLIALGSAGAYGSSMASHYNCRPSAPEVLVDGSSYRVVRPRGITQELWRPELISR